tara:strand:+ start:75579 stop:77414 length:1836 start_codon:yes stop_codon:yes gene_type:complete
MKKIFFLSAFLFSITTFAQKTDYKTYSYTQFFQLIENEKDTIFTLKNAVIKSDTITDKKYFYKADSSSSKTKNRLYNTDTINKAISLNNVFFLNSADNYGINHIVFTKEVSLTNVRFSNFNYCVFKKPLKIKIDKNVIDFNTVLELTGFQGFFKFEFCEFLNGVDLDANKWKTDKTDAITFQIIFGNSIFYPYKKSTRFPNKILRISVVSASQVSMIGNTFLGKGHIIFGFDDIGALFFNNNKIEDAYTTFFLNAKPDNYRYEITDNEFYNPVILDLGEYQDKIVFGWDQLKGGLIDDFSFRLKYTSAFDAKKSGFNYKELFTEPIVDNYLKTYRVQDKNAFKNETKLLGKFFSKYKEDHDTEFANKVYIEIKDLETKRLEYLHQESPSFKGYFTWKVNQFLKVFSAYGTEPARAIVFSLYVILIFAMIYLFFPNSWDSHGKNRIIDRYSFFLKYMNKKAGIHEVYLDDQKEEIMQYDTFKTLITTSGQTVPKFFSATALPMYKWAVSGTKVSAWFLKRIDIMKGTWSDLPKSKRIWKSILLVGAFLIAISYDVFIKMLNALMLSINTFTTLGFGEIPIKGLPRYLAIVQGFIGWFMLTIFSVSLISQLLN